MISLRFPGIWVALFVAVVGCQDSKYQLAPVSGVVTLDGQPLVGGLVNFQPMASDDDANPGPGSTGICDPQGKFVLSTIDDQPGAVVGQHRVRVYSVSHQETTVSDEDSRSTPRERIPERYNYRSKLDFQVDAAGSDQADFELSTK